MKLTIEAFRGAKRPFTISFDQKNHLSVVYGENGSGKTTISDALQFLYHGTAGSLEEKSLDGKNRIVALVHANCNKGDLLVKWEQGQSTVVGKIDGTKAKRTGSLSGSLHTLSRKNITKLIEETPTKRFERIQEFVTIPALDREEIGIRDFIVQQRQLQENQLRGNQQAELELDSLYREATENQTDPIDQKKRQVWASGTLSVSLATLEGRIKIIDDLNHEITRLRDDFKPLKNAYLSEASAEKSLKEAKELLTKLIANSSEDFASALDTLEHAHSFLEKTETDTCPICDTVSTHSELTEKVSQKLLTLKPLVVQSGLVKEAAEALQKTVSARGALQEGYYAIITKLREAHVAACNSQEWAVPNLVPSVNSPADPEHLTTEWFESLTTEAAELKTLSDFVDKTKRQLLGQQDIQKRLRAILLRIKDIREQQAALIATIAKGEAIASILRSHRIDYANETLLAISDDFANLYQAIHPGEEIEKIRLYLHATQKNAARFDGTLFGNEEMSPVACLSESHLDTLGLCLFLALQKKESPGEAIVYLDDAIASVDEAHMERLYGVLLSEAKHFRHVIITSCYQPLRFKFRWGLLTQAKVNFIELGQWSLTEGINLAKGPTSEVSYLRRYLLERDDAGTIAAKAGVVLERVLDFLTGIYQCRLPRNPGAEQRWTLDHYKGGLQSEKKLMPLLRCEHIVGNDVQSHLLEPLLADIFSRLQFRNALGCHYKEIAGNFNEIAEAVKLGEATLALVNAICDENDELPDRQDGVSWANRGVVSRRLYPLIKPA